LRINAYDQAIFVRKKSMLLSLPLLSMGSSGSQLTVKLMGRNSMKRLCAVCFALALGLGCATESDQAQWNEAMKDLRGDNMRMRTGNWGKADSDDSMPSLSNSSLRSSNLD
jgi:hypothetical protein